MIPKFKPYAGDIAWVTIRAAAISWLMDALGDEAFCAEVGPRTVAEYEAALEAATAWDPVPRR